MQWLAQGPGRSLGDDGALGGWKAEAQLGWTYPGDTGRSLSLPPFCGGAQAGRWRSQGGQGGRKEQNVSAKAAGCRLLLSPSLPSPSNNKATSVRPWFGLEQGAERGEECRVLASPAPNPSKAQPCPNHRPLVTNFGSKVCRYASCNEQACTCTRSQPPCSCIPAVHSLNHSFIHSVAIHGPRSWVGQRLNASC